MRTWYKRYKKLSAAGMAAAFVAAYALGFAGSAGASAQDLPMFHANKKCVSATLPVAMGEGKAFNQKVYVTYCQPTKWAKGPRRADVLTEGATYNGSYWDWPQNPSTYSYVDKTLAQGRATLDYDRIGAGKSSHPLSTDITEATDAYVLHQLVQVLHLAGFQRVDSIGHSYGSGIIVEEAATYHDVSDVVATGYLHRITNPAVVAGNYPANQDAAFAGRNLDDGYLTSKPGSRATSFYASSANPAVIAYDEVHKDLVSKTGLLDFLSKRAIAAGSNMSNAISVPVLIVEGRQDALFCNDPAVFNCADHAALQANEQPYYTGAPSLQIASIPDTGHDLTLHPSANQSFDIINNWLRAH